MSRRNIVITDSDHKRLKQLLASEFAAVLQSKSYVADLQEELQRADIVNSAEIPNDVVTMNSTVRLRDLKTDERDTYTLVYPDKANIADYNLSILAPIGTAILGYRVGDSIRWRVPSGPCCVMIEELVYQPERDGVLQLEY